MRDSAVRCAVGMSQKEVARWASVGLESVRLYEANPNAVGARVRDACSRVYRELHGHLARLERIREDLITVSKQGR